MSRRLRIGSARERTNRAAMEGWGTTLRLALLRTVSAGVAYAVFSQVPTIISSARGG